MKRLTIPCDFGGQKIPFHLYVGDPEPSKHPLQHQAHWLSSERGGSIPPEVMESFEKLHNIAKENGIPFEDLCMYAMGQASDGGGAADGQPPSPSSGA